MASYVRPFILIIFLVFLTTFPHLFGGVLMLILNPLVLIDKSLHNNRGVWTI